jgi:hypothetical protein
MRSIATGLAKLLRPKLDQDLPFASRRQRLLKSKLQPFLNRDRRSRGPDASPSGGPQLSLRSMRSLPGVQPEKNVSAQ